jgi:hypothetical protein
MVVAMWSNLASPSKSSDTTKQKRDNGTRGDLTPLDWVLVATLLLLNQSADPLREAVPARVGSVQASPRCLLLLLLQVLMPPHRV